MKKVIFISYRRADSAGYAGRIYDRLRSHFGDKNIFMDVSNIDAGEDFVEKLTKTVQTCDVLIAFIGKQWLTQKDDSGRPRLENPDDFVRIEVQTALNRNIRVIPVLVDGTSMPGSQDLPGDLKPLARRNAISIDIDSFDSDVNRLIKELEKSRTTPQPNGKLLGSKANVALKVAVTIVFIGIVLTALKSLLPAIFPVFPPETSTPAIAPSVTPSPLPIPPPACPNAQISSIQLLLPPNEWRELSFDENNTTLLSRAVLGENITQLTGKADIKNAGTCSCAWTGKTQNAAVYNRLEASNDTCSFKIPISHEDRKIYLQLDLGGRIYFYTISIEEVTSTATGGQQ